MKDWKREGDAIHIIKQPRMGCAYFFIGILGLLITLGASLFLLAEGTTEGFSRAMLYGGLVLMFGLVFLLGGIGGRKFNFKSFVEIQETEIRFRKLEKDQPHRMDMGEIEHIACIKVMKSHGSGENSRSYPTYQIFLRKRDGAYFWLDTFRDKQHFVDALDMVYDFLGLEVRDRTGFEQNRPATKSYEPFPRPEVTNHSKYISIERNGTGTHAGIRVPRDFMTSLLKVLVFGLFLGVPGVIAYGVFADAGDGVFAWIMMIFVGSFVFVFVSLVLVIMLMTIRRFELEIASGKLLIHQRFPLLVSFLNRTSEVAAGMIRSIRVNRLDDGHFSLSVAVDKNYKESVHGSTLARLMLMLGAFSKPGTQIPEKNREVINLWEIPGYQAEDAGANYMDLLFLEKLLQDQLGVREDG